jgi:hypothetical protein
VEEATMKTVSASHGRAPIEGPQALGSLVASAAGALLASSWVFFATAKVLDSRRGDLLSAVLPRSIAEAATWFVIVVEIALGLAIGFGRRAARLLAIRASLALLVLYGVLGVLLPDSSCRCAGRVAPLSPVLHSALVGVMLLLVWLALRASPAARVARHRDRVATTMLMLIAVFAGSRSASEQRTTVTPRESEVAPSDLRRPDSPPDTDLRPGLGQRPAAPPVPSGVPRTPDSLPMPSTGIVLSPSGEPVAGARVWPAVESDPDGRPEFAVTSNASGEFRLAASLDPEATWLCAIAPGHSPWCGRLSETRRGGSLVVRLSSGRSVEGAVVDEAGRPLADVRVSLMGALSEDFAIDDRRLFGPRSVPRFAVVRTDQGGRFRLVGLALGEYRFRVSRPGFHSDAVGAPRSRVVLSESTPEPCVEFPDSGQPIRFTLSRIHVLRVSAFDAATGVPVPTAEFALQVRRPWAPAFDSETGLVPEQVAASGLVNESEAVTYLRWLDATDAPSRLPVVVTALGWKRGRAEVEVSPFPGSPASRVPLERDPGAGESGVLRLEARWPSGLGFDGALTIVLKGATSSVRRMPARFQGGACNTDVTVPLGDYEISLQPGEGSTFSWAHPSGRLPLRVSVRPGERKVVPVELQGGRLVIAPSLAGGLPVREFWFTVESAGAASSHASWMSNFPFERTPTGGVVLYLDSAPSRLWASRVGAGPVEATVAIPDRGAETSWTPALPDPR